MRIGQVLRALRLGWDLDQEDLAARVGLERSWISRLERGRKPPKAAVVQAWVSVCPIPVLPVDVLVSSVLSLSESDRLGVLLLLAVSDAHPTWGPAALRALRLPAADVTDDTVAPAYLWLSWVAGRHWEFPESTLVSESLERHAKGRKLLDGIDLASVFGPLWDRLSTVPSVALAGGPSDQIFAELAALWPRIRPELRPVVLRLAEELARIKC